MKTWLLAALAVLLGLGLGLATAAIRIRLVPWEADIDPLLRPAASPTAQPRVVVDQADFDFGRMDTQSHGSHEFRLTNRGDGPLRLERGTTTCKCTVSTLRLTELLPGQSTIVLVEWKSTGDPGPYRESATILTNDPNRPRITLTITGLMVASLRVKPAEVTFPQLSAGESASAEVRVFGYRAEPLAITGYSVTDKALGPYFQAVFEPIPEGEVKEEKEATSGVRVRIGVKSGLPQGTFRQTIILSTNFADRPTIELPVQGTVTGDLAVYGPGWNPDGNVLVIGPVNGHEGARRALTIVVRGPHRQQFRPEIAEVHPEFVRVELGETSETAGGAVRRTPLWIEIPKGVGPGRYTGTEDSPPGRILIKTHCPQIPELRILLMFVVEG